MKHIAWVFSGFQTHRGRCKFGTETVWVGCELEVCGGGAGTRKISQIPLGAGRKRAKTFQPAQDSTSGNHGKHHSMVKKEDYLCIQTGRMKLI